MATVLPRYFPLYTLPKEPLPMGSWKSKSVICSWKYRGREERNCKTSIFSVKNRKRKIKLYNTKHIIYKYIVMNCN